MPSASSGLPPFATEASADGARRESPAWLGPAERWLCGWLRDEAPRWPTSWGAERESEVLEAAAWHGLRPVVHEFIQRRGEGAGVSVRLRNGLAGVARRAAAVEMVRREELLSTLSALARQGVRPILLKGTPLAYTYYDAPHLRERCDTDLLIPERDVARTRQVLEDLGYRSPNAVSGSLVSYQSAYAREDRHGIQHTLDLHWRLNNGQVFANVLSFGEIERHSVAVPALGDNARGLGRVHALLLALIHRAAHSHTPYQVGPASYYGGNRLIWLYDVHLLVGAMTVAELTALGDLAARGRLRAVCRDGLETTASCFGTPLPPDLMARCQGDRSELSAAYLEGNRLRVTFADLRSLPDWPSRVLLLREHVFPPADYMLRKYARTGRGWLPALYAHRGLMGVWRLLRIRKTGVQ